MALTDIDGKQNGTVYYWYYAAYNNMNDYASTTSVDFGKGASNTRNMLAKWNNTPPAYGAQNAKDSWGQIQEQVEEGWYVPSRAEWTAFGGNLSINKSNYASKGLSNWCWSSSQYNVRNAWYADFSNGYTTYGHVNNDNTNGYVRLGTTF